MIKCIIIVWFSVIYLQWGYSVSQTKSILTDLQQIHVIFRHGDRFPETYPDTIPNDPNMYKTFYPAGSGGLTNDGKNRAFQLGKMLRNKYEYFLSERYYPGEVHAISTDVPRTKMSLQLVLAGLYPPLSKQVWNENLNWQPIPANYLEFKSAQLFSGDKCEEYLEEFEKILNTSEVRDSLNKYKSYFQHLTTVVGKKKPLTLEDVFLLHNNLDCEDRLGLEMQPWMRDILKNGTVYNFRLYYQGVLKYYNAKLVKLFAGQLSRQITDNFIDKIQGTKRLDKKIFLYSGHDSSVMSALKLVNRYDLHIPEFSSAVIFKLLKNNDNYYVEVLYYLGIPPILKQLTIPGCEQLCPFEKFLALTEDFRADKGNNCTISQSGYFEEGQ